MSYKIAYLTSKDPSDKRSSSGVYYFQAAALKRHFPKIDFLGPVDNFLITIFRKGLHYLQLFRKKKYGTSHSIFISMIYGRIFSKKLRRGNYDIVFAEKASCEIAYIKTGIPIIYSTDATFSRLHNYYPDLSNILKLSVREGNFIEQKAINKASLVICASNWAASSAINDYNKPSDKVHVLPRGANIDRLPDITAITGKRKTDVCRLLFIGRDWHRKGYDVAYKTMEYIRSAGTPVRLVAVGCSPPAELTGKDVQIIPFINKNTREGCEQFDRIMYNSDFLLQPTRAECLSIVFCESMAYGLPVITRDTGGVAEIVRNGINGYALSPESGYVEYGELIMSIFESEKKYYDLVLSSREYFEKNLNWEVWSSRMKEILDDFMSSRKAPEILKFHPVPEEMHRLQTIDNENLSTEKLDQVSSGKIKPGL
jgi:glycosyltransferase involved in cell wall biosynthesis